MGIRNDIIAACPPAPGTTSSVADWNSYQQICNGGHKLGRQLLNCHGTAYNNIFRPIAGTNGPTAVFLFNPKVRAFPVVIPYGYNRGALRMSIRLQQYNSPVLGYIAQRFKFQLAVGDATKDIIEVYGHLDQNPPSSNATSVNPFNSTAILVQSNFWVYERQIARFFVIPREFRANYGTSRTIWLIVQETTSGITGNVLKSQSAGYWAGLWSLDFTAYKQPEK